jgi:hypothetical protein
LSKNVIGYETFSNNPLLPAKSFIPEWYKSSISKSLKKCVPFLDAFMSGYVITLPNDLHVSLHNETPEIKLADGTIYKGSSRDSQSINIIPFNHYDTEFAWDFCIAIHIPAGASLVLTHPFNRYDLPFTTLSGIIDGEFTIVPHGAIPFYIQKGFEGIIKAGTPIAQLIPFNRDSWTAEVETGLFENSKKYRRSMPIDWYKKSSWKRKSYD